MGKSTPPLYPLPSKKCTHCLVDIFPSMAEFQKSVSVRPPSKTDLIWWIGPSSKWLKANLMEEVPVLGNPAPMTTNPSWLGVAIYSILSYKKINNVGKIR